jgi:pyridoxal/pyridoxine/pyridoxamine kinase
MHSTAMSTTSMQGKGMRMTEEDMQQKFNEANKATGELAQALFISGYTAYAEAMRYAARLIDQTQHDYTELTLDPS